MCMVLHDITPQNAQVFGNITEIHILLSPLGEPQNGLEMCASWQCHHFWFIGVPDVVQERVLTLLAFPYYGP